MRLSYPSGVDLPIRPIDHRNQTRVRAHTFLGLQAYCAECQIGQALAPLRFDDEPWSVASHQRDPVAPAQPSPAAQR